MFRYDEESQFLDKDAPRIAHNIGALVLTFFGAGVGGVLAIAFLVLLV